jgi:hypothetical protein
MSGSSLEQDIAQLEQELQAKRQELQGGAAEQEPGDREVMHHAVGEKIKQHLPTYQSATPPASGSSPSDDTPAWQNPAIASQVQTLVDTAFSKGLDDAIRDAIKTQNPAVIDAFHDVLRDQLLDELVRRGKLPVAER